MAGIYDEFRELAVDLMSEFAVVATLSRVTRGYDEAEDETAETTTTIPCRAVIVPRKVRAEGGRITYETIAKLSVRPLAGDSLTMGTEVYLIGETEEVAPDGGAAIIYMAKVTK